MGDRSSDSEVIERNRRGADRGGADSPPRPTPTTPNGTPLPRGPPPARPIHEEHRDMSLALSNAIGQTFLEQGGYLREVLTLLPGQWEYLNAITVQIRPLTPTDSFHPNVLNFEEEDAGHVDEPAEGATEHGEGHNDSGTGSRSGTASSSRNPEPSATTPWTLSVASAKPKNRKPRPYCSACLPLIVFVVRPQPVPNLPYNSGGQDLIELGKQVLSSESIHRNRLSHIHHNRVSSRALGTDLLQMMTIDNGGAQLHKSPPATSSEIEFVQGVAVHFYTHWLARYFFTDETHTASGLLDSTFPVCAAAIHTHVDVFNRQPRRDVLVILILLKWYKVAMLPVSQLYGLKSASSWYPASLKPGYDRDLPRGDDGNSRLWRVRPSRQPIFAVRHLAEHIPFPYASIRLISGTWATLNQVGLMLSFLIALLLRVITAGTFEKSLTGRVGPKSDRTRVGSTRTSVVPILLGLIFWLHIVPVNSVSADVRVDVDPTRTSEAVTAKHVGYREALQPGNTYDLPRAAKRSYRRAYARSCRQGGAFYKGVWRPHSWYRPVQITTRPVGTTVRPHTNTKALRTLTWNAGGLHAQVFRELVTYAIDASLDLIYIQETKWSYDANWSTPEFHFVHSAGEKKEDKVGGVLIMVSTRVIKRNFDIQFNVVHPGRLLHVRINMQQSLDLINVYQYAANDHKSTPERRYRLLLSLQKTLQGLPNRNILILAGDMNTTCTPTEKVCGRWVMPATELHNKDSSDLMAILSTYSLSVLNSWIRPRHRQLATFTFGQLASQIDYVICRQSQATNCAKQAAVDTNFPVACWRDGAKHHPVVAHIAILHPQWKPRPDQPPQMDTTKLIADLRSQAPPPALQQLRAAVRHHIYTEAWTDIPQMECGMLSLAQDLYPRRSTPSRTEPEAHNDLSRCARRMWQLFRDMRSHQFTAQGLFTAWQQWTQFSRAHREHKQRAKARSKAGKLELLEQAHTAATQGDMHGVWKVVKTLAPKTKRKQLQLYKEGHIMSPTDEMKWIIQAFGERYGAREHNASFRLRDHPPVHITVAEIHRQLGLLPVHKAVPPEAAPAALWRACVDETTPFIASEVNRQWSAPELMIQQDWADANVALLPKAKARTDSPLDWRPIGLQNPVGKTLMKILVARAKDQIHQLVMQYPQTAYVPHRSTHTALKRVYQHCARVRQHCQKQRTTIHEKQAGLQRSSDYGGLQISMDLSAAFDLVPWGAVREALELAQVDPSVQEVMLQWLSQVRYIFRHKRQQDDILPSWGLRQGCTGSPVLWSVFTALLCRSLDLRLYPAWSRDHATLYADDSHLQWEFETYAQFEAAMSDLRRTFAVFRRLGTQINTGKTKAIISITGPFKHRIYKHYARTQGDERRLLLSPGDPSQWILLVDKAECLGLIISYSAFEKQSVQHRVHKANQRRWALAAILHTRRMSIHYKLRLWRSCVLSTLTYALHCLTLSEGHVRLLQRTMMKHIRALVSDQAFLTGTTHDEILTRFQIKPMKEVLLQAHAREIQLEQFGDWMIDKSWNQQVEGALRAAPSCPEPGSEDELAIWACPVCDCQFSSTAALKTHARRAHKLVEPCENIFDRTKHAVNGLPQCAGCLKKFSRWQTLQQHINNNSCPAIVPSNRATPPELAADPPSTATAELHSGSAREHHPVDTAISAAPADETTATSRRETEPQHVASIDFPARQLRLQQIVPHGVNHFIRFPELTQTMLRTCMLCGQWVASHKVMKLHYRNTHSQTLHQSQQRASRIIEQRATPCTTCHFCGGKHKDWKAHLHKCTALWQCSMLCAMYEEKIHDGRTDGGILRGCQDGKQFPGPVERVLASNDRSSQPI